MECSWYYRWNQYQNEYLLANFICKWDHTYRCSSNYLHIVKTTKNRKKSCLCNGKEEPYGYQAINKAIFSCNCSLCEMCRKWDWIEVYFLCRSFLTFQSLIDKCVFKCYLAKCIQSNGNDIDGWRFLHQNHTHSHEQLPFSFLRQINFYFVESYLSLAMSVWIRTQKYTRWTIEEVIIGIIQPAHI